MIGQASRIIPLTTLWRLAARHSGSCAHVVVAEPTARVNRRCYLRHSCVLALAHGQSLPKLTLPDNIKSAILRPVRWQGRCAGPTPPTCRASRPAEEGPERVGRPLVAKDRAKVAGALRGVVGEHRDEIESSLIKENRISATLWPCAGVAAADHESASYTQDDGESARLRNLVRRRFLSIDQECGGAIPVRVRWSPSMRR